MKLETGTIFKDYIVESINEKGRYVVKCLICDSIKVVEKRRLLNHNFSHNYINCRDNYVEKEYVGKIFDDMKVIGQGHTGEKSTTKHTVILECTKCGIEKEIWLRDFEHRVGTSHGMGCVKRLDFDKSFYGKYNSMVSRCNIKSATGYHNYGGRGIKCLYEDFIDFYNDTYESFLVHVLKHGIENTTIERIDVNGHYEKGNVTWATWEEQRLNKRKVNKNKS